MSDGSREALAVLGLLPVWKLRQEFQSDLLPQAQEHEQAKEQTELSERVAVRFIVIATSPQTQTLWRQILSAARGLSFLHEAISQAVVLAVAQRDRLQSILHESPAGTCFYLVGEPDLSTEFAALAAGSARWAVSPLPSLSRLMENAAEKRRFWAQLAALNRGLSD